MRRAVYRESCASWKTSARPVKLLTRVPPRSDVLRRRTEPAWSLRAVWSATGLERVKKACACRERYRLNQHGYALFADRFADYARESLETSSVRESLRRNRENIPIVAERWKPSFAIERSSLKSSLSTFGSVFEFIPFKTFLSTTLQLEESNACYFFQRLVQPAEDGKKVTSLCSFGFFWMKRINNDDPVDEN